MNLEIRSSSVTPGVSPGYWPVFPSVWLVCSPGDTSSSVGWEVLVDDVTVRTVEETVKTIVTIVGFAPVVENLTSFKSVPRS